MLAEMSVSLCASLPMAIGRTTEICFSNVAYRNEFQITIKGMAAYSLHVMTDYGSTGHLQATGSMQSLGQTVLVAVLVTVATLGTVFVLAVPGVAAAFVAGALSAVAVHVLRSRRTAWAESATSKAVASN